MRGIEASADKRIKKRRSQADNILAMLQIAASSVLVILLLELSAVPAKAILEIMLILTMLCGVSVYGFILGRRRRMLRIAAFCICIAVTVLLSLFSAYAWKSDIFITHVSNGGEERYGVSVIVMEDSTAESLGDLSNCTFAYVADNSSPMLDEGVREIQTELGPLLTIHPDNPEQLAESLYSGECQAIIIEESERAQIAETHEDFDSRTRTVWNHEITRTLSPAADDIDVTTEPFNIFLCGSDSRNNVDEVALNDLNMIVTVNPNTSEVLLTSIPRDYYVELASYGASDKLTHAGVFGTEEAMKTVEKFTGLRMDYYVKVSFAALVYVVDAIGGIDIESDTEFTAWTNPDIHIEKGMNHMYGVMALAYARERFAYTDGDLHRAQNQAQVMRAIANKASSPSILVHYDKLLDALAMGMKTSMSDEQIRNFIKMQLERKAVWTIDDYQMSGEGAFSKKCYTMPGTKLYIMKPDDNSVREALDRIEEVMNGETEATEASN